VPLHFAIGQGIRLDEPLGLATTQRLLERYQPKLVIMDSLIRVSSGNEGDAREMAQFFATVQQLKRQSGAAFALLHHTRKPGDELPEELGDLIRGSTEIRAWPDTIHLALPGDTPEDILLHTIKQRWYPKPADPYAVRLLTRADEPWAMLGYRGTVPKADRSTGGMQTRLLTIIAAISAGGDDPTAALIAGRCGLSIPTVRDHLKRLVALGVVLAEENRFQPGLVYRPGPGFQANGNGHHPDFSF
jgi:hypothetical protein